jgi:hypothetical protein
MFTEVLITKGIFPIKTIENSDIIKIDGIYFYIDKIKNNKIYQTFILFNERLFIVRYLFFFCLRNNRTIFIKL